MKIGIVGAGSMGMTLARHLARLRHEVSIASPRTPENVPTLPGEVGATPATVAGALRDAEVAILAVPTKVVVELPRALFAKLPSGVVVIDLGNYHPELRDGRIDAIEQGLLDSEWVAQQLGRPVIKAFNNILAESLQAKGATKGTTGRVALPVAGDSPDARATVLRLIDDIGFDPIDAGGLNDSWRQATGAPAYCKDLDAPALRRALAEAERDRVAEYRAAEEARIRRSLAAS
jgi:predicted dinucleotide-binding enzyme